MTAPEQFAALALRLQNRLQSLPSQMHADWQARVPVGQATAAFGAQRADHAGRRADDLFRRLCGELPSLESLDTPVGTLALLDRAPLLSRLAALALLARPGVLRCCVERQARAALREGLGPAVSHLTARAAGSPAVRGEVASWPPLTWSWIGYRELVVARAWPHRTLRRMVRLALPKSRSALPPASQVPAPLHSLERRLHELPDLFDEASPC